ncbi:MAG: rhodanese-like domain-containing protein [Bdellovibrionia bacterium]
MSFFNLFKSGTETSESKVDITQAIVIDVRTEEEFHDGHVEGAQLINLYDEKFSDKIARLDKDKHYALYCRSGNRSGQATRMMKDLGFNHVKNFGSVASAARTLQRKIV